MKTLAKGVGILTILLVLGQSASAQVTLISDDLNMDTSANYTIINGGHGPDNTGSPDGTVEFAFDYSSLGIPSAPGTTDSSTSGVKITVNETANSPGLETEAFTVFHNTQIVGVTDYTMTVDVYLGVWSASADTGSTEHAHIGVAGDGVTLNQMFQASPFTLSGSGHYMVMSGDGGDSSDYRHWRDDANGSGNPGPVNNFDPDYLSTDGGTNVTGDNFSFFEAISNFNAPFPGNPGDGWATVKVELLQSEGLIKYYVRGATDETTGDPFNPAPPEFLQIIESPLFDTEGFVSFGLGDLYNSVATVADDQYAIFDNLFVEGSNPIGTGPDCDFDDMTGANGFACDVEDINMLMAEIANGMDNPDFDLNGDTFVNNGDRDEWLDEAGTMNIGAAYLVADFNIDGNVDGQDFVAWNGNKFTPNTDWTAGNANGDLMVDGQDFVEWNTNKFMSSGDGINAVPEPAAGLMLMLAAALGLCVRRK